MEFQVKFGKIFLVKSILLISEFHYIYIYIYGLQNFVTVPFSTKQFSKEIPEILLVAMCLER